MASASALTDLVRPTKSGATIWGRTTRSLKGKRGNNIFLSISPSSLKNLGILTMSFLFYNRLVMLNFISSSDLCAYNGSLSMK